MQNRRHHILTEDVRRQRAVALEASRLRGNPAEESVRANLPIVDRPIIPVADRANLPTVEPDISIEIDHPRVKQDPPTKPKEITMGLPHVVIVGADKGGVGKTFVSRAVLRLFQGPRR